MSSVQIKRFVIEKLIPSLTGGYTFYRNQPLFIFWIHTVIFSWSFFVPLILVNLCGSDPISLLHPLLTLLFWFIIKLINFYIHADFDKAAQEIDMTAQPLHNQNDRDEEDPPFGISKAVWRIRNYLTNFNDMDINTIVSETIREGYNPNELFHFYELYQSGQLAEYRMDQVNEETEASVLPTEIHIFCYHSYVSWTRKDLETWFDRPYKLIEVIVAPLFAAICGILCLLNSNFITSSNKIIFVFSTAAAQYSLLLAPNPDSSSTTYQDPYTKYSRAFHLIAFQFLFAILTYFSGLSSLGDAEMKVFEMHIPFASLLSFFAYLVKIVIISFPLLNMLGMIGSLKDSWFDVIEVLHLIFFSKSGYVTFYAANLAFLVDTIICALLTFLHFWFYGTKWITDLISSLAVFFGVFFSSSNHFPFIAKKLGFEDRDYYVADEDGPKYSLYFALIRSSVSMIITFVVLFFAKSMKFWLYMTSGFVVLVTVVTQVILPELTSRNPFGKFSEPFFQQSIHYKRYMTVMLQIEHYALVPINIAYLILASEGNDFGLHQVIESLIFITMIICTSCAAFRIQVIYSYALAILLLSNANDGYVVFQMFVYLLIIRKLQEIRRKVSFVSAFSSFHSMSKKSQIFTLFIMLGNIQFSCLSTLIATFLNAPLLSFAGYPIFIPSFPRPTVFWFDPLKYEPHQGDSYFYKDISDSLSKKLATDIRNGIIPPCIENQFYIICDDYFNAIIHIIAAGVGYVIFQLRGLEVREQTLCHRNELQVIRGDLEQADEMKTFMISSILAKFTSLLWVPIGKIMQLIHLPQPLPLKQRAFVSSCCWRTINDDYRLDGYSVSANRLASIFPDRYHQDLLYINLVRALTAVIEAEDEILVPEDFDASLPHEVEEVVIPWIEKRGKSGLKREILSSAKVMINEMNKVQGDFEWKVYKYFNSSVMQLHSYLWIPSLVDEKLILCFRAAVSLAIFEASDALPEDDIELADFVEQKVTSNLILPESDPRWAQLVENREKQLETLRQSQETDGFTVKYMLFTRKEQRYKLVKVNDELVRGIWATQIMETVFIESTDRERASIQFDSFTLRNIISQSANSPVGYPEMICPISFSYSDKLI